MNWNFLNRRPPAMPAPKPATAALLDRVADTYRKERNAAVAALNDIIAMETPKCAHTAKKMAARAKAGLPASVVEGVS